MIRPDGEIVFVSTEQGLLYRIKDGRCERFAEPGHFPNGATEGRDGTIYITQAGGKRRFGPGEGVGGIQAVDRAGTVRWVTQDPISPNDLCFGPDGLLYLTDPTRPRPARDDGRLFRVDVTTGECELLVTIPWYPNGLAFGNDGALYVARSMQWEQRPSIVRFPSEGGRLGKPETFLEMSYGRPDGFLFDAAGNIVIAAIATAERPGEIQTYDRNGKPIDTLVPGPHKEYTNVALGPDRVLIITDGGGKAVLAVDDWPHPGLPLYPFRGAAASAP